MSAAAGSGGPASDGRERILISLNNPETTDELINLGVSLQSGKNRDALYGLCIVENSQSEGVAYDQARKLLTRAALSASATDNLLRELLRYDLNIVNGITGVVKEHGISDLILGLHQKKGLTDTILGSLTEGILSRCTLTTLIYKPVQPLATINRHVVVVPPLAERELGFTAWLVKIWNLSRNTGKKVLYYAPAVTLKRIRDLHARQTGSFEYRECEPWGDFSRLEGEIQKNDHLILVLSRKDGPSYQGQMEQVPAYMYRHFQMNNYLLIYPMQAGAGDGSAIDFTDPSLIEPVERLDQLGKSIGKALRRK